MSSVGREKEAQRGEGFSQVTQQWAIEVEFETKARLTPEPMLFPLTRAVIFGILVGFSVSVVNSLR